MGMPKNVLIDQIKVLKSLAYFTGSRIGKSNLLIPHLAVGYLPSFPHFLWIWVSITITT